MTIHQARIEAGRRLQFLPSQIQVPVLSARSAALDADCLLAFVLKKSRSYLFAHADETLKDGDKKQFFNLVKIRRTGLPIAYITGHKEFFGLDFMVTPNVLIPKPDTELLVEQALAELDKMMQNHSLVKLQPMSKIRIADICTGSGCVALSILKTLEQKASPLCSDFASLSISCDAADISSKALELAQLNAQALLSKSAEISIHFFQGDLLEPLFAAGRKNSVYNLIVTNPPYVPSLIVDNLLQDGRREPRLALDGGSDGLAIIRPLIGQAWSALAAGGVFLIETGEYNAAQTAGLMAQFGFIDIDTYVDLGGQPRVTRGIKPR